MYTCHNYMVGAYLQCVHLRKLLEKISRHVNEYVNKYNIRFVCIQI